MARARKYLIMKNYISRSRPNIEYEEAGMGFKKYEKRSTFLDMELRKLTGQSRIQIVKETLKAVQHDLLLQFQGKGVSME